MNRKSRVNRKATRKVNRKSRVNRKASRKVNRKSRKAMRGGFQETSYKSPFVTNMVRY